MFKEWRHQSTCSNLLDSRRGPGFTSSKRECDMRASKAAMGADLDITAEVTGAPINKESLLPMRNLDATSPEDVYKVEEILTERERTALSEAAGQMLESHDTLEKLKEEQKNRQLSGMGVALLGKALKATHIDLGHVGLLLFFEGCVRFSVSERLTFERECGPFNLSSLSLSGRKSWIFSQSFLAVTELCHLSWQIRPSATSS